MRGHRFAGIEALFFFAASVRPSAANSPNPEPESHHHRKQSPRNLFASEPLATNRIHVSGRHGGSTVGEAGACQQAQCIHPYLRMNPPTPHHTAERKKRHPRSPVKEVKKAHTSTVNDCRATPELANTALNTRTSVWGASSFRQKLASQSKPR